MTRLNAALVFIRRATLRIFALAVLVALAATWLAVGLDCVR